MTCHGEHKGIKGRTRGIREGRESRGLRRVFLWNVFPWQLACLNSQVSMDQGKREREKKRSMWNRVRDRKGKQRVRDRERGR